MAKEKKKAFDAACDYLSRAEHSCFEVDKKLTEKGYDEEERAGAIEKLKELRFLDDKGFAQRYIEFALAKGRGMRRIKEELRRKGISAFDMEDVLYSLEEEGTIAPESQRERALSVALQALGNKEPDEKQMARIGRKLAGLGYDSQDIYYAMGEIRKKGTGLL